MGGFSSSQNDPKNLSELTDISVSSPTSGQVLKYDGSAWVNDTDEAGTTINALNDIGDVTITSAASGEILKYNGSAWVNGTIAAGASAINDLTDVVISSPSSGQVLKYNGTNWVNSADEAGGGGGSFVPSEHNIDEFNDVVYSGTPANGEVLMWNGSFWQNLDPGTVNQLDEITDVVITTPASGQILTYDGTNWVNQTNPAIQDAADALSAAQAAQSDIDNLSLALNDLNDVDTTGVAEGYVLKHNGTSWIAGTVTAETKPKATYLPVANQSATGEARDVVITGYDFQDGATVTFGGAGITVNTITFDSASQLTANITIDFSAATGLRTITVENPDGQLSESGGLLNVVYDAPTVSSITPSSGYVDSTANYDIVGTGFRSGCTVEISGCTTNSVTYNSSTSLTVNVTGNTTAGVKNVVVTNPDTQNSGTSGNGLYTLVSPPSAAGYYVGGFDSVPAYTKKITKLSSSDESLTVYSDAITDTKRINFGTMSTSANGYLLGGTADAATRRIERLVYSSVTIQNVGENLLNSNISKLCCISGPLRGYGATNSTSASNTIEYYEYSSETSEALTETIDSSLFGASRNMQSSTKGYWCGGSSGGSTYVGTVDDMTFATNISARLGITLPSVRGYMCGISKSDSAYGLGAMTTGNVATTAICKLTFSPEAFTAFSETLNVGRTGSPASTQGTDRGHLMSGVQGGTSTKIDSVERLVFSSEDMQTTSISLGHFGEPGDACYSS